MVISGKIVSLKDNKDLNIFPETSASAVYLNDGKTLETLTDEGVFFGENTDVIQLNKPEMIEKVNNLQTELTEVSSQLEQNNNKILLITTYVTPEMYGAKGDGITDDTLAIQKAIDTGRKVILEKNYKFSEITIKNNLESYGILYGNVKINNSKITFKFNKMVGTLLIYADTQLIQHCNIIGNEIVNSNGIGLHLKSNGNGIQYNNLNINLINSGTYCVYLERVNGWVNNNYLSNTGFTGNIGIGTFAQINGEKYEGMVLNNVGMEHINKWFELNNCHDFIFQNFRCIPFEAHNDSISGELTNSRVFFDTSISGFYFEKITKNNCRFECIFPMSNEGERIADYMAYELDGSIKVTRDSKPQYYKKLSEMTSPSIIDYNYDYTKPFIINCDADKYMYINFQIPKVVSALKYVKIILRGTPTQNIDIAFNNVVKGTIRPENLKTEYYIYLV